MHTLTEQNVTIYIYELMHLQSIPNLKTLLKSYNTLRKHSNYSIEKTYDILSLMNLKFISNLKILLKRYKHLRKTF